MAKQVINTGLSANDRKGDPLRTAFTKINSNFDELYALTGGTSTELTELAQDYAAAMFVNGTHSGITVTYDDATNKINLTVPIGFSGNYNDLTNKPTIPTDTADLTDNTNLLGSGNVNTGDVTFEGSILSTPNTTDENWPHGVITLQPGRSSSTDYTDWGQFVNIYPTTANDAPHIHIAAGTGIQNKGDLILGDDNQHIDINHNGQIYVRSYDPIRGQQNLWSFDTDGTFYGPGMGTVITNAISGAAGNNLYLTGGNTNVRQSRVVRFTDADGTAKSVYTVDTNTYYIGDITFTNGQPTLWIAPSENASIASITPVEGTATFDFGNPIILQADTDYTIDWYILNTGVGNVVVQSPIEQTNSWTTVTTPVVNIGSGTVVWTSKYDYISSAKLVIQVECSEQGDDTGWHSQVCEAIIASRGWSAAGPGVGEPQMIVYGVVHTSINPLVTFTVQRNPTTSQFEVVGILTAAAGGSADLRIHSVEMSTRD